jgi:dTDP-3-amino-3,4,6-trideoxy-alpha-D-glucose transaminase
MLPVGSNETAIPLTRLDNSDSELLEELLDAVARVARAAAFTGGEEVGRFEEELALYCGTLHAVGLSSGTEALVLALRALGIGPGDEVIVPANSFIATAEAVTLVGATPRFCDVDPDTALVTAELLAPLIGPRTQCLIPVHLFGRTVALDPILALAERVGIPVIEDACQAHGAMLDGRRAGSIGVCGVFSFYPAKNLGAWGDAGALVTNDPQLADRVRLMRSHGERPRYHHRIVGTTARLDALQAAILRVKLPRLEAVNEGRRRVAEALTAALSGSPVETPAPVSGSGDHVYHQYVVRSSQRDGLREYLAARAIATAVHYPVPIHRTQAYAPSVGEPRALPVTETLAESSCSLPIYPTMTLGEIARVAEAVRDFEAFKAAA